MLLALLLALSLLALAGCNEAERPPEGLRYVGSATCIACHAAQAEAHRGSHHDLAMQPGESGAVLGAFDGREFEHFGTKYRFHVDGGVFSVEITERGGEPARHRVRHCFGVEPLQQYLVESAGGRLQALPVAWDTRSAESGGQRWFHLQPDEAIPPGDPLHWQGPMMNWNHMCADCHSTDVKKGWRPEGRSFATEYREIDVSCESCHGPGSRHVTWAEAGADAEAALPHAGLTHTALERGVWVRTPGERHARLTNGAPSTAELDTCARCHSRRSQLVERSVPGAPLLDGFRPALIEEPLYFADGQIRDEVFVWGSFVQSKMHAKGVTCSDCHDAHSGRLVTRGNALCVRCHDPEEFDTKAHHMHAPDSAGSACVDCHMPARHYMVVDPRRDHSFRVPRPDLSVELGTPNACNDCHSDQDAAWAEAAVAAHYGDRRRRTEPHFGQVFAREWQRPGSQGDGLRRVAMDREIAPIVRASALSMLGSHRAREDLVALETGLRSRDPLLRYGALRGLEAWPAAVRVPRAAALLEDPRFVLRNLAAGQIAGFEGGLSMDLREGAFARALREYEASQFRDTDRAEANLNLGLLRQRQGRPRDALPLLERATELGPWMAASWGALAELLRSRGDESGARGVLRRGLEFTTEPALLHHQLGLSLIRDGQKKKALPELRRARELAPGNARFGYVYAIALWEEGAKGQALDLLRQLRKEHPQNQEIGEALRAYER